MKTLTKLVVLLLLLITSISYGQDYYFINAQSGLNVRSGSNLSSKKIAKIPFGFMVEKIADTKTEFIINDNGKLIKGKFVKIKYGNFSCIAYGNDDGSITYGYVFDGYLKKAKNDDLITIKQIDKVTYTELSQRASKKIRKPKAIQHIDSIKMMLKNRVDWVLESEEATYSVSKTIKKIHLENGFKVVFDLSCVDFGFSEGYSAYYPEYDILVLEGGHTTDRCFSLKTGETELTIGNPEYMISSPNNSYRLNGYFGGQECISYFFQKNENGKFVYLTELNSHFDICRFKTFYWINETTFMYSTGDHWTDTENETDQYFMGEILHN
ncbi:SH3 domain-containing protein [Dokdonia ponticola]|uniref:SH3 domain-containing protein n=1 Tax=Dokdonia ponticola TaxID=2041041 RepID=A0ABV9I1T1_9FLAO